MYQSALYIHKPNFCRRQSSISRLKSGNARWPHKVSWVFNLLPSLNGPTINLQHYVTGMNSRFWSPSLYNGIRQHAQILMGDLGQLLVAKFRFQLPSID